MGAIYPQQLSHKSTLSLKKNVPKSDIISIVQSKLYLNFYYSNLTLLLVSGSPQSPYNICELFVNESTLRMATSLEDSVVSEIHNHIQASEEKLTHITTKNVTINNKESELAFYCYLYKNNVL